MKRSRALKQLLCALLFYCSSHTQAEVVIGPGVKPAINAYTTDHYHLLAGTQITSSSLTRPPADLFMRVDDAVSFQGGGSVRIDGGTYRGGNDTFTGPPDTYFYATAGHGLQLRNFTADIYGGTFIGGNAYSTSRLDPARGGVGLIATLSTVNIFGGRFDAGLLTQPNMPYYPSNYPQVADVVLTASTAHLHGGDLSYIILGNGSTLHVYGKNLEQVGNYAVYGTFADRSPIRLLIYNEGQIVLHDLVPEPNATWFTLLVGLVRLSTGRAGR
jgi:hypothetical protein